MAAAAEDLPFARQERLRFVEAMLLWEGAITRSRVCEVFGVTANHVTKDLALYQRQYPDGILFKPQQHAYVPGPKFSPVYASTDPSEYLSLLQARAETGTTALLAVLGSDPVPLATLPSPALGIDRDVLREVLRAIRRGRGLTATYHSLRAEQPQTVTLWPHALFNSGLRWYARAFDHASQRFREFVLSRIEAARPIDTPTPAAAAPGRDVDWSTLVKVDVIPHPKLNAHQQRVVAGEFAMKRERGGWVWTVPVRRCLIGYFARRYRLDAKLPMSPQAHFVVLKNRAALKAFLLPDAGE